VDVVADGDSRQWWLW